MSTGPKFVGLINVLRSWMLILPTFLPTTSTFSDEDDISFIPLQEGELIYLTVRKGRCMLSQVCSVFNSTLHAAAWATIKFAGLYYLSSR